MKIYKDIILACILFFLAGCATVPVRETVSLAGPTYNIGGIVYIPAGSIIDAYGLSYDWDSIAKKLTLSGGNEKIILAVGSDIALIKGLPVTLDGPVKMHNSIIVVPKDFASSGLARVFKYSPYEPDMKVITRAPSVYKIENIVIDAGHGGKDPGAIGQLGLREKDITLDIAKRLKCYLAGYGITAKLTRDDDRFVSLWKRADIANKERADFFISVHANSIRSRYTKGFEVYYLSEAVDDNARAVAASENTSLRYEDSSFGNKRPSNALEAMLWDIEYSENRVESIEMAKHIAHLAYEKLKTENRGVKGARFYVLKGAKMPSILIEVGFISNKQEAERLKSSEYREKLAETIALGIANYKYKYEKTEGFTR